MGKFFHWLFGGIDDKKNSSEVSWPLQSPKIIKTLLFYFSAIRTPSRRRTLPSATENLKATAVVTAVTEKYRSFICLTCQMTFETYFELGQHKSQAHHNPKKKCLLPSCSTAIAIPKIKLETPSTTVPNLKSEPSIEKGFGQDCMECVSNAIGKMIIKCFYI